MTDSSPAINGLSTAETALSSSSSTPTVANGTEYENVYENQAVLSIPAIPVGKLASYIQQQKQQSKPFDREFEVTGTLCSIP